MSEPVFQDPVGGPSPGELDLETLKAYVHIPSQTTCVFLSGSIIAGWAHRNSDLDVFVVTDADLELDAQVKYLPIGEIRIVGSDGPNYRIDAEYWRPQQVDDLVARVAAFDPLEIEDYPGIIVAGDEADFLYRLSIGVPLGGAEWLGARQETLRASSLRTTLAVVNLNAAESFVDDAVGLLASDDVVSASLAARRAFQLTVDALCARYGEFAPGEKWRAKRMQTARPNELSWDDYWSIETMSDYREEHAREWVRDVLGRCQTIAMSLPLN